MSAGHGESDDEVDRRVLACLSTDGSTVAAVAERSGLPEPDVLAALRRMLQAGLVEGSDGGARLTRAGLAAGASPHPEPPLAQRPGTGASPPPAPVLDEVVELIGEAWSTVAEQRAAREAREEAARDALLASDAERDSATKLLAAAYAQGRLGSTEFEDRTDRALRARTRGDLDEVLHGLGGLDRSVPSHPVKKIVFWLIAILTSPFVFIGTMLLAFGSDIGDHVGGLVMLVLFVPGLLALRRWAWPRS